jgi:hypothetical protein
LHVIGFTCLFWLASGSQDTQAKPISLTDSLSNEALGKIHAQRMKLEENLSTSCFTTATWICLGTCVRNNNYQFDALEHNGPNRQPIDLLWLFDTPLLCN